MIKSLYSIFCLGVLITGCTCDINCFVQKQFPKLMKLSTPDNVDKCRFSRGFFDDVRSDAKNCSTQKIKVDKLEAFVKELCTNGTELNNNFLQIEDCFGTYIGNALDCLTDINVQEIPEDVESQVKLLKSVCKKMDTIYNCFNEKVGKPCGEKALDVTQGMTNALSSYTTGLCLEVGGASSNTAFIWTTLLGLILVFITWCKAENID